MAIISFTNYKRGQTTGCMGAVMRYAMQDKKPSVTVNGWSRASTVSRNLSMRTS